MGKGIVSTVILKALVILSEAKDLFKLSEITDKPSFNLNAVILSASGGSGSFRAGCIVHRRIIMIRSLLTARRGVEEMLNAQFSMFNGSPIGNPMLD